MELTDLYSNRILEIAGRLRDTAPLENADATAHRHSRICGSHIDVGVKLDDGRVSDYAHQVSACALGQTTASIMAEHIVGTTPDELRTLRTQMYAMLKDNGPPPNGRWADLKYLQPVRDYKPRHTSTLLVFDAVVDCLDEIEGHNTGA